jgi:hypothetical protein
MNTMVGLIPTETVKDSIEVVKSVLVDDVGHEGLDVLPKRQAGPQ